MTSSLMDIGKSQETEASSRSLVRCSRDFQPAFILLFFFLIVFSANGCRKNKQIAAVPGSEAPQSVYQGPASEAENQATSLPLLIQTMPEPVTGIASSPPNLPLPSPPNSSKPPKATVEPRKEPRVSTHSDNRAASQPPSIQLTPQINDQEKAELVRKITRHLESTRSLTRSVQGMRLNQEQKRSLAAILDFTRKSEEALSRGDYYQSLVLAEKADTLAAGLAKAP